MNNKDRDNEKKYQEITINIQENERIFDDLGVERRQRLEQLEENQWKMNQQTEQILSFYQELAYFGDDSVNIDMMDIQEISQQVQFAFRSQEETFELAYQTVNRELEDKIEIMQKERGKLEW